jgi:hypothetical protein
MLRQHPFSQLGLVRREAYKEWNIKNKKYFAICWNGLALIGTLNSKNSVNYTQSAGKANTLLKVVKDIGVPQRLNAKHL